MSFNFEWGNTLLSTLLTTTARLLAQQDTLEEGAEEATTIIRNLEKIPWYRILTVVAIAWLVVLISRWVLRWLANRLPARFRLHILPLVPVIRLVVITIALMRLFPLVVNITPGNVIAILSALGVALGFAFKDYVSSLIAGIVAIYERPYRTGDWVKIDNDYGEVKSVGVRAVTLVTPDDTTVTIPHSKIWDNNIANANDGLREHQCIAHFYLHPAHDAELIRRKLWDVAMTSPYTQLKRPVVVIVQEKPWGTHYQLKAYPIDGRDEFQYITDLTVRGKLLFATLGVQPATVIPAVTA